MKNKMILVAIVAILSFGGFLNSCKEDTEPEVKQLTTEEKDDLLALREEEKLARDVYIYAYEKYGMSVSNNISQSEQKHMDKVLEILTDYGLSDPAASENGVFHNTELQTIYDALIIKVDSSDIDALLVGATVEDLDIRDIEDFINRTDKEEILAMYESLVCGSRNHMRAYYGRLQDEGVTYTAQYISQEDLDIIVNGNHESCGSN